MNIPCPQCQATLELPEDAHGKKARCPSCDKIFVVGGDEAGKQVQAGLPAAPQASAPASKSDEEAPKPRRRRRADEDEDETDISAHERDSESIEAQAKAATRSAGRAMLFAAAALMLGVVIGMALFFVMIDAPQMQAQMKEMGKIAPGLERVFTVAVPVCVCVFYAPFLLFLVLGGQALLGLKSKGIIITGIAFCFIMVAIELFGVLGGMVNLSGVQGQDTPPLLVTIVNLSSTILGLATSLTAAILAIKALYHPDVQEYYQRRFEENHYQRSRR